MTRLQIIGDLHAIEDALANHDETPARRIGTVRIALTNLIRALYDAELDDEKARTEGNP